MKLSTSKLELDRHVYAYPATDLRAITTLGRMVVGLFFFLLLSASPRQAWAIPSFAQQTGQPCSACHVGAFGPQLKPYGRDFKLYGYVTSDRPNDNTVDNWYERLTMMNQTSFTHTSADQNPKPSGVEHKNDNLTWDQLAIYYGGRITSTVGAIQEVSYDPIAHNYFWDALDIRHAHEGEAFGQDYVGGVLIGNQLGNTSIWNSTPPNAFPYKSSPIQPSPAAGTLLADDNLNGQILGPGAYISINSWIYAETTVYFPLGREQAKWVGNELSSKYPDAIPYWHVAVEHDFDKHQHYLQFGAFGTSTSRYPGTSNYADGDMSAGTKDHVNDLGFEANYQWLADLHNMISAHASYITEHQKLGASQTLGLSTNTSDHVNEFKADMTYSIDDTYVPTIGYFKTTGSTDALLYGSSANGSPNSEGYVIDLAYVPGGKPDSMAYNWGNMRIALEYTGYTQFNGTRSKASDNNTALLNLWFTLDPLVPAVKGPAAFDAPTTTK